MRQKLPYTLRGLLNTCIQSEVLDLLDAKHGDDKSREGYQKVMSRLRSMKRHKPVHPWLLEVVNDDEEGPWVNVSLLNQHYRQPPKEREPVWGLNGKRPKPGQYNAENSRYQQVFAAGLTSWTQLVDASIWVDKKGNASLLELPKQVLAEILWEMTFYGFSPESVDKQRRELIEMVDQAKKNLARARETKPLTSPPKMGTTKPCFKPSI